MKIIHNYKENIFIWKINYGTGLLPFLPNVLPISHKLIDDLPELMGKNDKEARIYYPFCTKFENI